MGHPADPRGAGAVRGRAALGSFSGGSAAALGKGNGHSPGRRGGGAKPDQRARTPLASRSLERLTSPDAASSREQQCPIAKPHIALNAYKSSLKLTMARK